MDKTSRFFIFKNPSYFIENNSLKHDFSLFLPKLLTSDTRDYQTIKAIVIKNN